MNEIVAKPNIRAFFVGLKTIEAIEGMLAITDDNVQKRSSVCF